MQMFPLMRTFAIIGILLVNVYSTKKYLVEVGMKGMRKMKTRGALRKRNMNINHMQNILNTLKN